MADQEDGIQYLADMVVKWHESRLSQIDEILNTPGDKGLKLRNEEDDSDILIEGEKLAGFRAGLHVAKLILGALPFSLEPPDEEEDDEEDEPDNEPQWPEGSGHFS
jgi:hypothetical protein